MPLWIIVRDQIFQRVLIGCGTDGASNAMLTLTSNATNVAGTVNTPEVNANTIMTTDIYLTTYDPRASNTLQVIEPYYQADAHTLDLASYASNAARYASNATINATNASLYASNAAKTSKAAMFAFTIFQISRAFT